MYNVCGSHVNVKHQIVKMLCLQGIATKRVTFQHNKQKLSQKLFVVSSFTALSFSAFVDLNIIFLLTFEPVLQDHDEANNLVSSMRV